MSVPDKIPRSVTDLEDEDPPELKPQFVIGEAGNQMKHHLKILVENRARSEYKDRMMDFLGWFPSERLEGYLLLALEYAVDKVLPAPKKRGVARRGGSKAR